MEIDEKIVDYKRKIALLQQKKKELAIRENSKIALTLRSLLESDENFYIDFLKLLEKYKAEELLKILEEQNIQQNQKQKSERL